MLSHRWSRGVLVMTSTTNSRGRASGRQGGYQVREDVGLATALGGDGELGLGAEHEATARDEPGAGGHGSPGGASRAPRAGHFLLEASVHQLRPRRPRRARASIGQERGRHGCGDWHARTSVPHASGRDMGGRRPPQPNRLLHPRVGSPFVRPRSCPPLACPLDPGTASRTPAARSGRWLLLLPGVRRDRVPRPRRIPAPIRPGPRRPGRQATQPPGQGNPQGPLVVPISTLGIRDHLLVGPLLEPGARRRPTRAEPPAHRERSLGPALADDSRPGCRLPTRLRRPSA